MIKTRKPAEAMQDVLSYVARGELRRNLSLGSVGIWRASEFWTISRENIPIPDGVFVALVTREDLKNRQDECVVEKKVAPRPLHLEETQVRKMESRFSEIDFD